MSNNYLSFLYIYVGEDIAYSINEDTMKPNDS